MSLKLVSVNIEGDNHLKRVKAFLEREKGEVICLMEVFEDRLEEIGGESYPYRIFAPNLSMDGRSMGAAILSKRPFLTTSSFYCDGREATYLPNHLADTGVHRPVVVMASGEWEGKTVQIGTTHFTWTPDGGEDERQKRDGARLLEYLGKKEEFVLTGDFNMARGKNSVYELLAERYKDNIPPEVTSTLDSELHRVNQREPGKLALVVDYLWTTPGYRVEGVRIEDGVSDHCVVVADIV